MKISDFGLSHQDLNYRFKQLVNKKMPVSWMAPESISAILFVLMYQQYAGKSDMYVTLNFRLDRFLVMTFEFSIDGHSESRCGKCLASLRIHMSTWIPKNSVNGHIQRFHSHSLNTLQTKCKLYTDRAVENLEFFLENLELRNCT